MAREGSNPNRRLRAPHIDDGDRLERLAKAISYVGRGHHKRNPADYGFERTSPRPTKSLCDKNGVIKLEQATSMLHQGAVQGLVSILCYGEYPKFVWFVDHNYCVYEAKIDENSPGKYHGDPLEQNDTFRDIVLKAWKQQKQES